MRLQDSKPRSIHIFASSCVKHNSAQVWGRSPRSCLHLKSPSRTTVTGAGKHDLGEYITVLMITISGPGTFFRRVNADVLLPGDAYYVRACVRAFINGIRSEHITHFRSHRNPSEVVNFFNKSFLQSTRRLLIQVLTNFGTVIVAWTKIIAKKHMQTGFGADGSHLPAGWRTLLVGLDATHELPAFREDSRRRSAISYCSHGWFIRPLVFWSQRWMIFNNK